MKILTQNLKTGKTYILDVPSPTYNSNKIRVSNEYSLISTGTESAIVNFGKVGWIDKARQQPNKVKDVINKIKSSGLIATYKAVKNKLDFPMVMGYSAVGFVSEASEKYHLKKGDRIFTNSCHQEEALIDYNMCVEIPENLDSKSATFGALGGIAMQSIKCIPEGSKFVVLIGLGLLGQITLRILIAKGYKCIVFDLDLKKIELAEKYGAISVHGNLTEVVLHHTNGKGADATIIAAASTSSSIVNEATSYTKRKGKIVSSGVIGLNLIRDNFFKKQIELVVSNSSGDKNHRGEGSSYDNIKHFFDLLSSNKVKVIDLISEETSFEETNKIYSFPRDSMFFSKLIKYDILNINSSQTFLKEKQIKNQSKIKVGLIGTGNFAMSTLIPTINKSKEGYVSSLLGREGLSLYVTQNKFDIDLITTDELDFYKSIDVVCVTSSHQTHYEFLKKSIDLSLPVWIEKPLVISNEQLVDVRKLMLENKSIYAVGYNRSAAPWTNFIRKKISGQKADIEMIINAGILPNTHWLLDQEVCGGRIIGEFCHFVDLSLALLNHTELINVECVRRDKYFQDTGDFILNFKDGSIVAIQYRYDLPPDMPKEKVIVDINGIKYKNYNWKKFSGINFYKKGKGHDQAIRSFLSKVKNHSITPENEIDNICFSTYAAIRLQKMWKGDKIRIQDDYKREILDKLID
jgi:D-arabinose 1-dehydrogenase-like Zn-dependent alcohol dehydrogenase